MMRGFTWTEKRDALLRELRRGGLSLKETARAIGCDVDHVRRRLADLGGSLSIVHAKPAPGEVASVPRPAGVARRAAPPEQPVVPPAARSQRRPLIDLSRAPSSMELAAERWSGR